MKKGTTTAIPLSSIQGEGSKKSPFKKPDSVKYLESLMFEAKRLKYPNFPVKYLSIDKFRDDTANSLTKCIKSFIQVTGGQCERISTTGRPIDRTKTFTDVTGRMRTIGRIEWIPGTATNGSADISATIAGRSVKIEVKIGADTQSKAQLEYQKAIESAGGLYFIAQDFTSFLSWYNLNFSL